MSNPSGNAGDRIACGTITKSPIALAPKNCSGPLWTERSSRHPRKLGITRVNRQVAVNG
jgi:hypothetical protein